MEGDPQTFGWDWLTFYPRLFLSHGLQLPLWLIIVIGCGGAVRQVLKSRTPAAPDRPALLLIACLGPALVFQFFPNKELRYLMPLVPCLSLLGNRMLDLVPAAQRRKTVTVGSVGALLLAAIYFFTPSWIPSHVTLKWLNTTFYQERILVPHPGGGWDETIIPIRYSWGLWNTDYFGTLGGPKSASDRPDPAALLRQLDVLLPPGEHVFGVIPFHLRFHHVNLQEEGTRRRKPWTFYPLGGPEPPPPAIEYIIGLYGDQGVTWPTVNARVQLDWLTHSREFMVISRWRDQAGEWMIWKRSVQP